MNAPVKSDVLVIPEERVRREDPVAQPLAVQSTDAGALLAAITTAASNPSIDVGKVERLWAIYQTVVEQRAEAAYNTAMARAQAGIQPVIAKSWNDHTKSNYAKLEAIDRVITPIHTAEGLSISYDTETKNDDDPIAPGMVRIIAWVRHSGGHKVRHHIDLPPDEAGSQGRTNKTKVQAMVSSNTYGRRVIKMMAFNVSTFNDKDGNSTRKPKDNDEDQQPASGALPEYPSKEFLKNLPSWKEAMAKGKSADDIIATVETRYTLIEGQRQRIRAAGGEKK